MSDRNTLLENESGTIVADGPFVVVCHCPGGVFEPFVNLVSAMAIVLSIIIGILVSTRAAPFPLILVALVWTIGVIVANTIMRRESRKHGTIRIDIERGEITQQSRGFSRTFPFTKIASVSTPIIDGIEGQQNEAGFEHRWLLVEFSGGEQVRLGRGPMHELRPTLAFLRKSDVPGMR